MAPSSLQCTGNPHTETNICIGPATTASPLYMVCLTPSCTGSGLSVQTRSYLVKSNDTSGLPSVGVITPNGSSTDYKLNWTFNLVSRTITLTPNMYRDKDNKTNNIYMVVPYSKGLSESFKNVCNKAGVQVHFWGQHHQGSVNGPQRTRTTSLAKAE